MKSSSSSVSTLSGQNDIEFGNQEPEWFQEFRTKVWKAFQLLPLESDPNMLNFLQTKILNDFQFNYPPGPLSSPVTVITPSSDSTIKFILSPEKEEIVFPEQYSDSKSITVTNLNSLLSSENNFIDIINSLLELKINDKLSAVALATLEWGSYIKIESNSNFDETINVKFSNSTDSIKSGLHIFEIGDGINASLHLNYNSYKNLFDHSVTFFVTGANSHINILVTEEGSPDRKTNRGFITKIGKDSSINFSQVQIDGSYARQRAEFYFTDEGGDLVEVACLRAHQKQNYDYYSAVYHSTPQCTSKAYARGVNDDESRTVFKGKVDIGKNGGKVNTDLSLHGLLLSKKSKFHSFPAMEVINNDVIATHGASVSQIDPEQIFYFQSRGINQENAEYMIASGYFEPAIEKIRSMDLQDRVRSIISKAVNQQFHRNE